MALNTVTLSWDLTDLVESGQYVTVTLVPSAVLVDATDEVEIPEVARSQTSRGGAGQLAGIVATDNVNISPAGWAYVITVTAAPDGQVLVAPFDALLAHANGATQDLSSLVPAVSPATMQQYLPLPTGVPSNGQVPIATGSGEVSAWGTPPGGAPSGAAGGDLGSTYPNPTVVGTHLASPLPVAQGGTAAASAGAALTSLGAAAASALTAETTRAEAAEALLAPLASPALTGTPTAPTKAALTSNTDIATTAYADSAVTAETSRAETAEGLLAPLASPALTGSPVAPTQTASDNSTKLATTAYVTTAVAGRVVSGQFLRSPNVYAPASLTPLTVTSTTFAAFSTGVACTGSFTAPPSGSVLVTCSFVGDDGGATGMAIALAAGGTVTPLLGNAVQWNDTAVSIFRPYTIPVVVTGLTPGNAYNLDLLGAVGTGTFTINAQAAAGTTITAGNRMGPVTMTVQAI